MMSPTKGYEAELNYQRVARNVRKFTRQELHRIADELYRRVHAQAPAAEIDALLEQMRALMRES